MFQSRLSITEQHWLKPNIRKDPSKYNSLQLGQDFLFTHFSRLLFKNCRLFYFCYLNQH
jgi:hypothetical protein